MAGPRNVTIRAGVSCQMGRRRSNNEDNFFLDGYFKPLDAADLPVERSARSPGGGVYAVCDGMGGQAFGERAAWMSAYGLSLFREQLMKEEGTLKESADACIKAVNLSIVRQNQKHHCQMGATLALAVLLQDNYHVFNLGDSRIYHFSQGALTQLSKDHTESQSLADMGILLPQKGAAKDGTLIQYLGVPAEEMILEPSCAAGQLLPGELLLLCSDGLTDMLPDSEIAHLLSQGGDPGALACRLTRAAEEAGGKDNVTALVISAEG